MIKSWLDGDRIPFTCLLPNILSPSERAQALMSYPLLFNPHPIPGLLVLPLPKRNKTAMKPLKWPFEETTMAAIKLGARQIAAATLRVKTANSPNTLNSVNITWARAQLHSQLNSSNARFAQRLESTSCDACNSHYCRRPLALSR